MTNPALFQGSGSFIRFVECEEEDPYFMSGIITMAQELKESGSLYDYEVSWLTEILKWINDNLPCPPFKEKLSSGTWSADAMCWFRDDAQELITRMWDIVAILKEHGVPVKVLRTQNPGQVVYFDRFLKSSPSSPWEQSGFQPPADYREENGRDLSISQAMNLSRVPVF